MSDQHFPASRFADELPAVESPVASSRAAASVHLSGGSAISAQPLAQQVASYIRDMIIHDVMKPGEKIREQVIAARFGISRTPIREALQMLSTQRLVVMPPNRGALVVDQGLEEVRAMLTVYSTLEQLGAELACANGGAAEIAHVRTQHQLLEAAFAAGDRTAYFKANQGFHLGIIAASGNSTLIEMHGHLNIRLYRTRYLAVMQAKEWRSATLEHDGILDALEARDGTRLGKLLREHLNFAWRHAATVVPASASGS